MVSRQAARDCGHAQKPLQHWKGAGLVGFVSSKGACLVGFVPGFVGFVNSKGACFVGFVPGFLPGFVPGFVGQLICLVMSAAVWNGLPLLISTPKSLPHG
jgi:hypothetical protein